MEIPNLSLNSTFSVPDFTNNTSPPPPTMCNYTLHSFECGHKAEDHVDSSRCPEFQRTGVHCDRDNPANRHRVTVQSEDRRGVCTNCSGGRGSSEIDPMEQQILRARKISLAEAEAHEEQMRLLEKRALEENLAEVEKNERAYDARIKELERQTVEAYNRDMQKRELADLEYIIKQSREEAQKAAYQAEMDMMERAFQESLKINTAVRPMQNEVVSKGSNEFGEGVIADWTRIDKTVITSHPPRVPPAIPPPLPPPSAVSKSIQRPSPGPPVEPSRPPKVIDYSLPAMGPQHIGRFKIGTRSQPEHESQRLDQSTDSKSPTLPTSPSPFARLGGPLVPNLPAMREARGRVIPVPQAIDARAGRRYDTGSDQAVPLPADPNVDPKLATLLAKRRTWEAEQDETSSDASLIPLDSTSNVATRIGSTIDGGPRTMPRIPPVPGSVPRSTASRHTGAAANSWDEDDARTLRMKRLAKYDSEKKG